LDDNTEAPQPLPETGWQRLWHLVGKAEHTVEEWAEMVGLHTQATAFVNSWVADPKAAFGHMVTALDRMTASLRLIGNAVPAAAGIVAMVRGADAALDRVRDALIGPPSPPDLPPPPPDMTGDPAAADPPPKKSPAAAAAAAAKG
jgi:hypothetical protein